MAVSQAIQEEVLKEAYSVTPNYDVDYSDARFGKVESDKNQALTELEQTYGGMIGSADKFYDDLKNTTQQWADKQAEIQQQQTDFAIEKIEQQKEQAQKDYTKEQSAAYVDWQKQSNKYGTEAEKLASAGLTNTGYSESSQVSMYNTYQNRVATAREVLAQAKLNYDNGIKEAMLQNSAALAEIYATNYIKQAELALQGFQYKNELVMELANKKTELDNTYYSRYQDVLQQINTENAMAEDIRQYNETMKWNTEQAELDRQFKANEAELDRKHSEAQAEIQRKFEAAQAELNRKHDKELLAVKNQYEKERLEQQHKNDMAKLEQQQKYELAQLDKQLANEKALLQYQNSLKSTTITGGSSGGGSSSKKTSSGSTSATTAVKATNKSTATNTTATPNMQSVLALGYGPISGTKLAQLVNSGAVIARQVGNQIYYTKSPTAAAKAYQKLGK